MTFADFARSLDEAFVRRPPGGGRPRAELVACRTVDSTHRLARRLIQSYLDEDGEPPRVDVVAWEQEAGRGRGDRSWASPAGAGVYASLVRPVAPAQVQGLPLAVAVALAEALGRRLDGRCRLSWPNDLVVAGRKLGGILIDVASRGEERPVATVSFGVDVGATELFAPLVAGAAITSLTAEGVASPLAEITFELLVAVDAMLAAPPSADELAMRYRTLTAHRPGETLRCRLPGSTVEGRFLGFDGRGFLRLEVGGSERQIAAGEVMGLG